MLPGKILVATDFSENSVPARLCAVQYATVFKADLLLLHIVNTRLLGYPTFADKIPPAEIASIEETIRRGIDEELELLANDCKREVDRVFAYSRSGAPAEEIVRFADENEVGLIVVGTHGWTGVKHLILGSTAENIVRTANCPVLTVRSASA